MIDVLNWIDAHFGQVILFLMILSFLLEDLIKAARRR